MILDGYRSEAPSSPQPSARAEIVRAAVVCSDIVDAKKLADRLTANEYFKLLNRHVEIASSISIEMGAWCVQTDGDAVIAVLSEPAAAFKALQKIRKEVQADAQFLCSFGLTAESGLKIGTEFFGPSIVRAKNLSKLASANAILIDDTLSVGALGLVASGLQRVSGYRFDNDVEERATFEVAESGMLWGVKERFT